MMFPCVGKGSRPETRKKNSANWRRERSLTGGGQKGGARKKKKLKKCTWGCKKKSPRPCATEGGKDGTTAIPKKSSRRRRLKRAEGGEKLLKTALKVGGDLAKAHYQSDGKKKVHPQKPKRGNSLEWGSGREAGTGREVRFPPGAAQKAKERGQGV